MLKSRPGFEAGPRPIWACQASIYLKKFDLAVFRPFLSIFDTFNHPSFYFRPYFVLFYRFLTLLTILRAMSDLIQAFSIDFDTFNHPSGYFRPYFGLFYRFLTLLTTLRAISDLI
jgi:hypothetical protein